MDKSTSINFSIKPILLTLILAYSINLFSFAQKQVQEDFNIFQRWIEWSNGENMLRLYLNQQEGIREVYHEVLKGYAVFEKEEDFLIVEDHAGHSTTKNNREAVYRFFQKYLSLPGNSLDEEVEILNPEELQVTETGQISTSLGGETAFSINKKTSEQLYSKITVSRQKNADHLESVKNNSMELSGYHVPEKEVRSIYRGSYQREGYTVGMYALEGESGYVIPVLLAVPDGGENYQPVIYIHPEGKEEGIGIGGNIEKLVKQGYIVAAPDLLGIGETEPIGYSVAPAFEAILIGRSIVGIHAGDIVRVVTFLKELPNVLSGRIQAVAFGEECPALLHAAAYEPSISCIALIEAPVSYYNITQTRLYGFSQSFAWGVAGALTAYDLPDLTACIAPRKLIYIGLSDAGKKPASTDLIADQMAFPLSIYAKTHNENLRIIPFSAEGVVNTLIGWLKE